MMSPEERGAHTERRFFDALSTTCAETPVWFKKVKRASIDYDMRGVDALAVIVPKDKRRRKIKVPIQIKSSELGKWKYWHEKPLLQMKHVLVIVVNPLMSDDDIRALTFKLLTPYHESGVVFDSFFQGILQQQFTPEQREKITAYIKMQRRLMAHSA